MKKLIIVALLAAIGLVWYHRQHTLPENGVIVRVCTLLEKTTWRVTGPGMDNDLLPEPPATPHEFEVTVLTPSGDCATIEIEDESFYRSLRVGDDVIGIMPREGVVTKLERR